MTLLPGRATADGTAAFARRARAPLAAGHFRRTRDGLTLSSLGIGTYIGRPDAPTDLKVEEAVRVSLTSGRVNVIDTAINYRYQRAERSIGRALAPLVVRGDVDRSMVFVATKAGYLAPDAEAPIPPEDWVETTLVRTGVLAPEEIVDGSHAMSPSYLTDQVERSRRNLGLETIDLVYLHNAADAQLPVVGPEEFRHRLEAAFGRLESLRAQDRLVAYGLATWDSLRRPPGDPGHFALEEACEVAASVGGPSHGFRFVQFPFNLAMSEASLRPTQTVRGRAMPLFEAAAALGLGCFTSVPLVQGQLARHGPTRAPLTAAQTALQYARSAPGSLAALVGQKTAAHLSENLALAEVEPWDAATFLGFTG